MKAGRLRKITYYRKNSQGEFIPCKPRRLEPDRGQRERYEHLAAQVRGRLISRLDDLCHKKILPELEEIGIEWNQWISILQIMQVALFPEEFAAVPPTRSKDGGLIPPQGISSVSEEQFIQFARAILKDRTARSESRSSV